MKRKAMSTIVRISGFAHARLILERIDQDMDSLGYPPCVGKYAAERASRINKAQSVDFLAGTILP
jgi:hypothetical protein